MSRRLTIAALLAAGALGAGASAADAASTLYVSASAASDPACAAASKANPFHTLAGALACATKGSTIKVGAGTFPAQVTIPVNVTIAGAGPKTVLQGSADINSLAPAITIPNGRTVTISKLTIDGQGQEAQGISSGTGKLTVSGVTVENTGVHVAGYGAGLDISPGSGTATVTVTDSTFVDNYSGHGGAGIAMSGPLGALNPSSVLTVTNSTFTGNVVDSGSAGGAIRVGDGNAVVRDSTISGNSASTAGGIFKSSDPGTLSVTNTIVAGNSAGSDPDCVMASGHFVDGGHNLVGVGCASFVDEVNGDQVGTAGSPIDPVLAPLASNSGTTQTLKPQFGSPAIGAGDGADCQAAPVSGLDQRGKPRNTAARVACDIGAYDTGGTALKTFYVSANAPSDPTCAGATQKHPFKTLAAALNCTVNGTAIQLGAGTFTGGVTISHNVVLRGAGPSTVLDGTTPNGTPNVAIAPRAVVTFDSLTLDGGNNFGVGIRSASGRLTVTHSRITRSLGAISSAAETGKAAEITVVDSTIDHNFDNNAGAGILVSPSVESPTQPPSSLSVLNSTIADNDSEIGGLSGGGAIYARVTAVTLRDSTISGNHASTYGGGLFLHQTNGVRVTNTILAGNTAGNGGADCYGDNSAPTTSGGHNVIGQIGPDSGTGCQGLAGNGVNGDQVGTTASPLDPMLGTLADNGGPTQTMAPQTGSPAIGAGSKADATAWPINGLDQRGVSRNAASRGVTDVGAYDTGGTAG